MRVLGWVPDNDDRTFLPFSVKIVTLIVVPLYSFVFLAFYGGALYSFLSMENIVIKNVGDLLNSDFYLVGEIQSQTVNNFLQVVRRRNIIVIYLFTF